MPLYKVSLRFAHDNTWPQRRKWSTTMYTNGSTAATAAAAGVVAWVNILRPAVDETVFCYEVYASDLSPNTDDYTVQAVPTASQRGTRSTPDGEKYLLKACVGVTINVPGSRPSRKFWRVGLHENDVIEGNALNAAVVAAVGTAFQNLADEEIFVDPDNQLYASVGRLTLTTREFGRYAGNDVPAPPVG